DLVENVSSISTSDGISVDQFSPTVTDPFDGSTTEDVDWQQDNTTLIAAWQGNDTREIDYYEFSFGTTQGDSNIVNWTDNGTNTNVSVGDLSLTNGTTYYVNVRAYDMAGNRSDMAVSDGLTIDFEPPSIGEVRDGVGGDIWLSNSSTTVSANCSGFTDTLSGIQYYEFALGTSSGSDDIIEWINNGLDSAVINYTGLNLQHAESYYFSVRATDLVGNISAVASSDGFVIDIYPGPPTFVSISFDTTSELLTLTDDTVLDIVLSEPAVSMDFDMTSIIPVIHTSELNDDSIQINLTAPFASLDTLTFSISNLTDMVGLDSSYSFTIYTITHADYNDDGMVDVTDLTTFTTAWISEDFSMELGPVTGTVPHLIPTLDNVFDLRDIMSFARMWHWSHETPLMMLANLNRFGPELDISQSGKIIEIGFPDGAVSSQILINYDQNKLEFEHSSDLIVDDEIQLKSHFQELGNLLIEKSYLTEKENKQIAIKTRALDKEDSFISIQYTFLDQFKNVIAEGFVTQKIIAVPDEYALHSNYPNPFNPVTTIQYDLPEDSHVNLIIYNILGREVKILVNKNERAGYKSIRWNGRNNAGQQISAGMYFYRIETAGFAKVNKMILLR
ncbi:MAG: T9SS type A sorting domain-containing protein, partial [Candidatus Marinimicrobia bacterium]|nr:T9SS type A sorting domain-containing protein [Candidatus Neomarinimicrobiota bacterium]